MLPSLMQATRPLLISAEFPIMTTNAISGRSKRQTTPRACRVLPWLLRGWSGFLGLVCGAGFLVGANQSLLADRTNFQDGDLLLVFRKDGAANDVLFNLGTVSNYLGLATGTGLNVTNWDLSMVKSTYGNDLSGVKYVLLAASDLNAPLRVWVSAVGGATVVTDETYSKWSGQRSLINSIGASLNIYSSNPSNAVLVLSTTERWTPFFGPKHAEIKLGFQILRHFVFVVSLLCVFITKLL